MADIKKDYFHFKKFSVKHSKSAMKVGFDGILLGAWCHIRNDLRLLDVGSGTGLIALMMAQRNKNASIYAIEPDFDSFEEAQKNFLSSPWSSRLEIENVSIQDFCKKSTSAYDHIVCNPPYFSNSILSGSPNSARARHTVGLTHESLLIHAGALLSEKGRLSVVLPEREGRLFIQKAFGQELYPSRICEVITKQKVERLLITLSKCQVDTIEETLIVYNKEGEYSSDYKKIVRDYYLKM